MNEDTYLPQIPILFLEFILLRSLLSLSFINEKGIPSKFSIDFFFKF